MVTDIPEPPGHVDENIAGKIENLNPTDDGESSEQPHCSSNSRKLCHKIRFLIFCNHVIGRGVEYNLHQMKFCLCV